MAIATPTADAPKQQSIDSGVPRRASQGLALLLIVIGVLAPFAFNPISNVLNTAIIAFAYIILALGLNVVVGFAGLLDLGYVAFFAVGAYAVGWFASSFANGDVHLFVSGQAKLLSGIHVNFLIVLVIAMVLCAIAGVLIGLPTLRLRGDYIAIVTLAFGEIIRIIAINGNDAPLVGRITAGRQGITPVDQVKLPFFDQFTQLNLRPWYWLIFALMLIVLFCVIRLRDSRLGRAWIAIREDEVAASSMGVPLVKTKLAAYAVGAAIGGISGAFQGSYLNTVNADQFSFQFSIIVLAMVILGGLGSIWGVVVGAAALSILNTYLLPDVLADLPQKLGLGNFQMADINYGIFGFLLVIFMVLRPQGLIPEGRRKIELTGEGTTEAPMDAPLHEARGT